VSLLLVVLAGTGGGVAWAQTNAEPLGKPFSPPVVLEALKAAYPGLLSNIASTNGDWWFTFRDQEFCWANGRLLLRPLSKKWISYAPQPFYQYPATAPEVALWTREKELAVEALLAERKKANVLRNAAFFDTVWRIHNLNQADDRMVHLQLFGHQVTMHQDVVASLKRIETVLKEQVSTNEALATFLKNLSRLEGFNWRNIAGTESRSNHAYGTAIDLIPNSYQGRAVYWLWAVSELNHWYKWTWQQRWLPPDAVVTAFEDEGWVWGGKWMLFDTIHFEYRPEILILSGLR